MHNPIIGKNELKDSTFSTGYTVNPRPVNHEVFSLVTSGLH
jgi:hypothetical protein